MSTTVEFLRPWRGRKPGDTSSELGGGVSAALAQRGIVRIVPAVKKGMFDRFKQPNRRGQKPANKPAVAPPTVQTAETSGELRDDPTEN